MFPNLGKLMSSVWKWVLVPSADLLSARQAFSLGGRNSAPKTHSEDVRHFCCEENRRRVKDGMRKDYGSENSITGYEEEIPNINRSIELYFRDIGSWYRVSPGPQKHGKFFYV